MYFHSNWCVFFVADDDDDDVNERTQMVIMVHVACGLWSTH